MTKGQQSLFRDMEIVDHSQTSWYFAMFDAAEKIIKDGRTFTSEDLTDIVGMPPEHHHTVGSTTMAIVRKFKLKSHGRVGSRHKTSHGAKLEVWGK